MMKILTTSVIVLSLIRTAGPAMAQDVHVRVKVSHDVAREIQEAVESAVGADIGREIAEAIRSVTVGLPELGHAEAAFLQNREFRSEQTQRETNKLQVGAAGTLELKNVSGDIVVTAGSGREATVDIVRVSRGRTDADAKLGLERVTVEVDQRGERATVQVHYPDEHDRGRSAYNVSVSYQVNAPAGTHVTAESVGGSVSVTGIRGDLTAASVGGNVTITDAGRIVSAKSVGGTVTVNGAQTDGTFEAGSVGGSVTVQRIKAKRISVSTIGGNVSATDVTCDAADLGTLSGTVEFSGPLARSGRYELHAQSGSVRFTPTNDTGFELQARTFSGEIRTDSAIQLQRVSSARGPNRNVRGTFGDGSAVVVLSTFSGNVVVTKK